MWGVVAKADMATEWPSPLRRATGADTFSEETVFRILRNKRRRYALHYLKQRDEAISVGDLAEQIAAWEHGIDVFDVSPEDRKRVYISLLQSHLPTMADSNIVVFDEENSEVRLTDDAENIDIYVELVPEKDIQWSEYYLALSAFSGAFIVAAMLGVFPLSELPSVAWFGFVVVLFTLSSVVHYIYHRQNRLGAAGEPPE